MIERVSEKEYADFMRDEVFLPLGLTHTSIDVAAGLEPHQAIRYTPGGKRIPFYEFDHPGASAAYASAHDLVRFAMFHMKDHLADQRAILSDASIDAMQQATTSSSPTSGYGIGWGSFTNSGGYACVQHTGGMPGVSTVCRLVPAERLAVVVLANSRAPLAYGLADTITDIVLPEKKDGERPAAKKDDNEDSQREPFAPSSELIGTWKGKLVTYQGEAGLTLEIKDTGDVHVRVGRQLLTLLNDPSFRDGVLRGRFNAKVLYDDDRGRGYNVQLELKLRDANKLNGAATCMTWSDDWGSSAVTHWAELERQP